MNLVVGSQTKLGFLKPTALEPWSVPSTCFIDVKSADQIVTVSADVAVSDLQNELKKHGMTLPIPDPSIYGPLIAGLPGTIGGLLAANLPHGLSAQCGGPRHWVLQVEVEFQGERAKSGAKVVKSVAGYDVHKAYVGTWGSLGPILAATLRVRPLTSLPRVEATEVRKWSGQDVWIGRTLPDLFHRWLEQAQALFAYDEPSCTLWAESRPKTPGEGWLIGPSGERWSSSFDAELSRRLKSVFDPEDRWYAPSA